MPQKVGKPVESVSSDINPQDFFERFVSKRQPAHFSSHITDAEFSGEKWSNDYLRSKSGSDIVRVEYRDDNSEGDNNRRHFGKGLEENMPFSNFIDILEGKNSNENKKRSYYLTTQELTYNSEGQPALWSAPVTSLANSGDFPLTPKLMGNSILANANIWMGSTSQSQGISLGKDKDKETSSGLHHDFHDNLYIVLRGCKRLILYPPNHASNLYTYGKISYLHENGLINYAIDTKNDNDNDFH